jgi:threonine synthase
VVCVLTGNGLKDPHTAERIVDQVIDAPATLGWRGGGARMVMTLVGAAVPRLGLSAC